MIRKRGTLSSTMAAVLSSALVAATSSHLQAQAGGRSTRAAAAVATRMQEAQALVQAYTALVTANHDYQGHRAAAAHAVHQALKALHAGIAKFGNATQQAAINQQMAAVASADKSAKQTTMMTERQPASDAQLAQAQQILTQVQQTMAAGKQERVLVHVNRAIEEIQTALQVR